MRAGLGAVLLVLAIAVSGCSGSEAATDPVRDAYNYLIEEVDKGCPPGTDAGPGCRPHIDELVKRGKQLRATIEADPRADQFHEVIDQLDWLDRWAGQDAEPGNRGGLFFTLDMLRDWADHSWPK